MEDSLEFKIKGGSYTIKCPTKSQFDRIQSLKQILSGGQYSSMMKTYTDEAQFSLDLIDTEATLTVLAPEFIENLAVPFGELGMADAKKIKDAYTDQIVPWWNELMKALGLQR